MTEGITTTSDEPDAAIRIFCAHAVQHVVRHAIARLEQSDGLRFVLETGTMGALKGRIASGETADLAILSDPIFVPFAAQGVLEDRTDLARTEIATVVRAGGPSPDIATADAFARAVLAAQAIACTNPANGGTAGVHLADVFARMGIAETVAAKARYQADGHAVSQCVVDGGADFGLTLVSEIVCVPGAQVGMVLPADIQCPTTYAVGIFSGSAHREGARTLISDLAGPASVPQWRDNGFTLVERAALPTW